MKNEIFLFFFLDGNSDGSNLLSKVAPPSALPSFVPLPTTTAPSASSGITTSQSFYPTKFR